MIQVKDGETERVTVIGYNVFNSIMQLANRGLDNELEKRPDWENAYKLRDAIRKMYRIQEK